MHRHDPVWSTILCAVDGHHRTAVECARSWNKCLPSWELICIQRDSFHPSLGETETEQFRAAVSRLAAGSMRLPRGVP
jgi:hypothetical protein